MKHSNKEMISVRAVRDRLNMSQTELATLLGKSMRTIQRWEADDTRIDVTVIRALKQLEAEQS